MSDPMQTHPELSDLVDLEALKRLFETFARLHHTGLSVVDSRGNVVVDAPPASAPCLHVGDQQGTRSGCRGFEETRQASLVLSPRRPLVRACRCGLKNSLLAIRLGGHELGCLIYGPFTPEDPAAIIPRLLEVQAQDGHGSDEEPIRRALEDLKLLPLATEGWVDDVVRSLGAVIELMIQNGYTRYITSKLHIAAIQDAYNELSEKNQRLADSLEKLRDLDRMKSRFLAAISHELRTPLTSIIGYADILIEEPGLPLDAQQAGFIRVIREKGEQLLQIITEVLDMACIESGRLEMTYSDVELGALVQEVVTIMAMQVRRKDLRLVQEIDSRLPSLRADRAKLRQLLQNLLANAIKFTPRGGFVQIQAVLGPEAGQARSQVQLRVCDSGPGVPIEAREQIFEAFYQVDSSTTREFAGTGLGLAIVQRYAAAHGGRVWYEPGHPTGSVFVVELPVGQG